MLHENRSREIEIIHYHCFRAIQIIGRLRRVKIHGGNRINEYLIMLEGSNVSERTGSIRLAAWSGLTSGHFRAQASEAVERCPDQLTRSVQGAGPGRELLDEPRRAPSRLVSFSFSGG